MKNSWQIKKLGEICDVQNGYAFDSKLFSYETGIPLIRIRDLKNGKTTETKYSGNYDERYVVNSGDFLIGMDGEFSCYEWKGGKALLNQRVCRLQNFKGLDPRFLFYGINKYLKDIEDVTGFTTVKHISSRQIVDILFPHPESLVEQKRIVKILDAVFEKIFEAKNNSEINFQDSKKLFTSYSQSIFSDKEKKWDRKKLSEICTVERGSSPRPIKQFFTDDADGVNWIKIGDTKNLNRYIYSTNQKITRAGAEKSREVNVGDLILSNSMSFGKPYIMKTKGYIHDGWFVLRPNKNIDTEYFYDVISSPQVQRQFLDLASGSVVKNISGDLTKKATLPVPSINEQKLIVAKLQSISEYTKKLEANYKQKITDLDELKKSLLTKAFAGEL